MKPKNNPNDPRVAVLKRCVSLDETDSLPNGWFLMRPENTANKESHWKCNCNPSEKHADQIVIWVGPTDEQEKKLGRQSSQLDAWLKKRIKVYIVFLKKVLQEQKDPVVKKIVLRILRNPPGLGAVFWIIDGGIGDFIASWKIAA